LGVIAVAASVGNDVAAETTGSEDEDTGWPIVCDRDVAGFVDATGIAACMVDGATEGLAAATAWVVAVG